MRCDSHELRDALRALIRVVLPDFSNIFDRIHVFLEMFCFLFYVFVVECCVDLMENLFHFIDALLVDDVS